MRKTDNKKYNLFNLILGLAGPYGAGCSSLAKELNQVIIDWPGCYCEIIHVSELIQKYYKIIFKKDLNLSGLEDSDRREKLQKAGTKIRQKDLELVGKIIALEIYRKGRELEDEKKLNGIGTLVFIIDSIKNTNDLNILKRTYNNEFYFCFVHANEKTRSARFWTKSTIADILKNEVYLGWTVFNKKDRKANGKRFKAKSEWVIVKNTHDPIIDEDLFFKLQKQIEERMPKNTPGQTTASRYILSGLMKCVNCGAPYGVSGYGRNKRYAYYNCLSYSKKGKKVCEGRRLRSDKLEKEIIERVKDLVFSEEKLEKMINDLNQIAKSLRTDYSKNLFKLRKNLNEIQLRITRQYEAIESGIIDISLVAERLKELKIQKERVENEILQIEELSRKSSYIQIDKRTIDSFRKEMEEIFIGDNPQEKREFLKKFIETIIVGKRNITVRYYLPNSQAINIYHEKTIIH